MMNGSDAGWSPAAPFSSAVAEIVSGAAFLRFFATDPIEDLLRRTVDRGQKTVGDSVTDHVPGVRPARVSQGAA